MRGTGCCSGLGVAVSGLACLVGVIYVGLWSGELVVVVDWELACLFGFFGRCDICESVVRGTGCFSGLGVAVSGLASLVGVIYVGLW